MLPIEPPIIATRKRVASGIRKDLFFAFSLSIPIIRNPIKLITPAYTSKNAATDEKNIYDPSEYLLSIIYLLIRYLTAMVIVQQKYA